MIIKNRFSIAFAALSLVASSHFGFAAQPNASGIDAEVKPIMTQIQEKLKAGKQTEADLGDSIKQLDALITKHAGEKTEEAAHIYFLKGSLYLQVLDNDAKATETYNQIKRDFAGTESADTADKLLAQIKAQEEPKKIQRSLAVGTTFPDFNEKDAAGKPLSIAKYRGKVVLIDFWATWCGPCVAELPNVLKAYEKYHGKGFEIIGISLDQEEAKLTSFTKQKGMAWQQYFDGQEWTNKLAVKYGVRSIPATYLLDGEGKIIAKDLRGPALEQTLAKALAGK